VTGRERVARWIDGYERAWRSPGTDALSELFEPDATYLPSPYEEPIAGLEAIGEFWDEERVGPDEPFDLSWEPVALDGDLAVVRVAVHYHDPPAREYRDLWVIRFGAGGRCSAFEEWPFWPGKGRSP
jgi:ketosteroid isomerase-like protein